MIKNFKTEIQNQKVLGLFILAVLVMLIGTAVQYHKSEKSGNNDFRVYYKTAERISDSNWEDIYTRKDGPFPYRYIPYSLMTVSWINYFPEKDARKVWVILQALSFAVGFYFLYRSLLIMKSQWPLAAVSCSMLLTFRLYMDSLYSGQVAGFIFLSFCLGLYFFLKKKMVWDGMANSLATSLKIFPGILIIHGLIKAEGSSNKWRLLLSGLLLFVVLNAFFFIWLHFYDSSGHFVHLWRNWIDIVLADSEYFDGSTPKSQSLRAFMLRAFGRFSVVEFWWKIATLAGLGSLIFYWCKKKAAGLFEEGFSYCLGIMAFIFFMPESLPYQVMNIAIPFALLMGHSKIKMNRLYKIMLVSFMLVISFASSDFIGRWPADKVQALSLPFFVMCLITYLLFQNDQVVKT